MRFYPLRPVGLITPSKKEEPFMKNAHTGKIITHILTILMCAVILVMIGCCFNPYFTVSKPYHFILNPNPVPDHYSLIDLMWTDTVVITEAFEEMYPGFDINLYVTNLVLSFIFGIATVITCIWHLANELRRFPTMTSGIITNICGICWAAFSLLGYLNNAMLDAGTEAFMGIRTVIIILSAVGAVLVAVRFVVWLLTEIQVVKERKARLALL